MCTQYIITSLAPFIVLVSIYGWKNLKTWRDFIFVFIIVIITKNFI